MAQRVQNVANLRHILARNRSAARSSACIAIPPPDDVGSLDLIEDRFRPDTRSMIKAVPERDLPGRPRYPGPLHVGGEGYVRPRRSRAGRRSCRTEHAMGQPSRSDATVGLPAHSLQSLLGILTTLTLDGMTMQ